MRCCSEKLLFALMLAVATSGASIAQDSTVSSGVGPELSYLGPMTFGPDGVLLAADSEDVYIYALDLSGHLGGGEPGAADIEAVDEKIAAVLGTDAASVMVTDLAVYPGTRNAFISVMRGKGAGATPVLLRVDGAGAIEVVPLEDVAYSRVRLPNPPGEVTGLPLQGGRELPIPNYPSNQATDFPLALFGVQTITDLAYRDGRVYVAGLSNEEFASKMRVIPYPFRTADRGTSVEIYHGAHGQLETFSPVFTFVPYEIDGEPSIVASYLCTPLVKFPISALQPGGKIQGTTIAEFGNRNRPLDMIVYEKDGQDYILLSNNQRGVMKVPTEPFAEAVGIDEHVPDTAGVPFETIASMQGVRQLDLLDPARAMLLVEAAGGGFNLEAAALP